jgi:ribonuclease T1
MRWARLALMVVLAWVAIATPSFADDTLRDFARAMELDDLDAFVDTVVTLRERRALPPRYLTKQQAESRGWRPGRDLCRIAPGRLIGGDRFGNREGRLPSARNRIWREADLDYPCGARNARRLVFSSDGLIFITVDHYDTFKRVP